jgi:hypothetical protein
MLFKLFLIVSNNFLLQLDAPNVSNTILNYFDSETNQLKRLLPIDTKQDSESSIKDSLVLSPLSQRYFLF